MMHAIKNKQYEAVLYLLTLPNGKFDPKEKNGLGNTSLHLAVKTGQLKFVKSMIMKLAFLSSVEDDEDFDPKFFNLKLLRDLSLIKNNKGYTPLLLSVDEGNTEIFQFLLSLLIASDQLSAGAPLLP